MRWIALTLGLATLAGGCASQECDLNSDCEEFQYCLNGRCERDCAADFDCPAGLTCNVIGRCVEDAGTPSPDAGPPMPGVDAGPPTGTDAGPPLPGVDAGPPTGTDAGPPTGTDAGPPQNDAGPGTDAGPSTGPVARGTYRYGMLPIALGEAVRVAFHPDGSYAVVLERSNIVHVYDWVTRVVQRVDLNPPGSANVYFHDLAFDPGGAYAYVVGADVVSGSETGVIYRMDDAMVRAGMASSAFTRLGETRAGERFSAVEFPLPPRMGDPIVMSTTTSSPYIARLRELSPSTDTFVGLFTATNASAGCGDFAFADNAFGGWGALVVCGLNGADGPYYTAIGMSMGSWSPGPSRSLGNTWRVASHPTGDYALAIGGSGNIHRFEAGAWRDPGTSPRFSTRGIFSIAFQQDGSRALAVGRAGGSPLSAAVLEYRHDLWTSAEVSDVSIPGFASPPYSGDSSTYLNEAAWRPGCDGGLIVGGKSNFAGTRGMIVEFRVEGLRSCGGTL